MSRHWLRAVFLLGTMALLGAGNYPLAPNDFELSAGSRVAAPVSVSDTLRSSTKAGTPLVLSLPAELQGTPVTRYTVLQGPALCGVADRSFTWIPRGATPGTYDVRLEAHHPDSPPDTLVVQINLQS